MTFRLAPLLIAGLLGCRQAATVAPPKPSAAALRVAVVGRDAKPLVERAAAAWAARTSGTVTVHEVAATATAADADIVVVPPYRLPAWAATGTLARVPEAMTRTEAWLGVLPLYRSRLCVWEGKAVAWPVCGEATLLAYRADLYADAGHKAAYAKDGGTLEPPADAATSERQAAFWATRLGRPSLPPWPADDAGVDRLFGLAAAARAVPPLSDEGRRGEPSGSPDLRPFSFHFDLSTGRPRVGDPPFVEALRHLHRLQQYRVPAGDRVAALRDGGAAFGLVTLRELGQLRAGRTPGRWGVTRPPGVGGDATPYLGTGGWLAAVVAASPHADVAHDFLAEVAGQRASQERAHDPDVGAAPTRRGQLDQQADGWLGYGLGPAQTVTLRAVLREQSEPVAVNPAFRLRLTDEARYEAALLAAVRKGVTGADAAASLAEAAAAWEALESPDARRGAYRQSVNLQ